MEENATLYDLNNENQGLSNQENVECVKARLQEEGREARNLIAYSLPSQNWKNPSASVFLNSEKHAKTSHTKENKKFVSQVCRLKRNKRHRSASAGRDSQAGLRARHWGFLFRNLQQAVDEIYQTAEDDESIIECKEAILMLERYAGDFYKLIEWLKLKWEYENTSPPQRPTSLAWEIRTSSPAKIFKSERRTFPLLEAKKYLNFAETKSQYIATALKPKSEAEMKPQMGEVVTPQIIIEGAKVENVGPSSVFAASKEASSQPEAPLEEDESTKECETNLSKGRCEKLESLQSTPLQSFAARLKSESILDASKESLSANKISSAFNIPKEVSTREHLNVQSLTTSQSSSDVISLPSNPDSACAANPKDGGNCAAFVGSCQASNYSRVQSLKKEASREQRQHSAKRENKKCEIGPPSKSIFSKPAPLVNMNKASQVRKAFNQSKSQHGQTWKNLSATPTTETKNCVKQKAMQDVPELSEQYSSSSSLTSSSNGLSWADKVKTGTSAMNQRDSLSKVLLQDEDQDEGWELVRRNRRSHGGSAASLSSQGSGHFGLNKRGGVPFHIQRRFDKPSSAMSMPSLTDARERQPPLTARHSYSAKSDADLEVNNPKLCSKGNFLESRKLTEKRKMRGSKKDSPYFGRTKAGDGDGREPKMILQCNKQKKNAANTKTQNEVKNCSRMRMDENDEKVRSKSIYQTSENNFGEGKKFSSFKNENSPAKLKEIEKGEDESWFAHERDSDSESEREREEIRCNAEAFECVLKEEEKLKQQIKETEKTSFEDCDIFEKDGDGDTVIDGEDSQLCVTTASCSSQNGSSSSVNAHDSFYSYDSPFSKLSPLSWAEEMDIHDNVEAMRPPGRVLHIHEKLSSPSRKLPISEKLRRHQEKLAKAQELRGKLIMAKTEKLKDLFRKIDEVNIDKERLLMEKRGLFERKMERAEKKRQNHLQEIVNKAHDEENKAKEIAFINGLEAQNKLHDIMQQHHSHESRLADMAEERSRRQEEKAAKEAAAQKRRKTLEAERRARMLELCEKRRKRCERIDRQQAERREELLEQAREKARDREERLSALQQAQQAKESELVKKIQQKQEETARRHEENIEQIRQKALESSILKYSRGSDEAPKLRRYETKMMCTLCSSVITSEVYLLSHLCSFRHKEALKEHHKQDVSQEESETYNLKFIINAPANIDEMQITKDQERQKALQKRCRKIRSRMTSRGKDFLKNYHPPAPKDLPCKGRMSKALNQIKKVLSNQGSGPWPTTDVALLDKHLLELLRILERENEEDQRLFASLEGFRHLFALLELIQGGKIGDPCVVPARSLAFCARVMVAACKRCRDNCRFLLHSNVIGSAIEHLLRRLQEMAAEAVRNGSSNSLNSVTSLPSDPAAAAIMELLGQVLQEVFVNESMENDEESWSRLQDVVSYCVSLGVADKLSWYFSQVQNPVENDPTSAQVILAAMRLLSVFSGKLSCRLQPDDPTQLIATFHVLDACGVVSLLYGLLLHQGGRSSSPPAASLLSSSTLAISTSATAFLHNLAHLDLSMFQAILGSEGISLEFRHIASFLLWYCSHWPCEQLLHNVIGLVGFFAANNRENQSIIQSGETPSVLQQLCSLPWPYFSEPHLINVLFPTLLACCLGNDDNINILQQEMTFEMLENYQEENKTSQKPLLKILQSNHVKD